MDNSLKGRQFSKNDSGFACVNCKKQVKKLGYTSRNHCPYCLHSLHVDNMPGDRSNTCGGVMRPISVAVKGQKGYVITFECEKCKQNRNNVAAKDDSMKIMLEVMQRG